MNVRKKSKNEYMHEYLEKVTPEFIAEAKLLSLEWSWIMVGCKLLIPANRWQKMTNAVSELSALRDIYRRRNGRKVGTPQPSKKEAPSVGPDIPSLDTMDCKEI